MAFSNYRIVQIPKGRGRFRTIYIANKDYAALLKSHLLALSEIHDSLDNLDVSYGFRKGRNCALMALQHIGRQYVLRMDLKDFFESVSSDHLSGLVGANYLADCLVDGHLCQGFSTSPVLANIAFSRCDRAIVQALHGLKLDAVYTRYADDLVFGFDDRSHAGKIKTIVRQVVNASGFVVNEKKTCLQSISNGRLIIGGIGVDFDGLHASRKTRKKIRAAYHQGNVHSVTALEAWASCSLPKAVVGLSPPNQRAKTPPKLNL